MCVCFMHNIKDGIQMVENRRYSICYTYYQGKVGPTFSVDGTTTHQHCTYRKEGSGSYEPALLTFTASWARNSRIV